MMYLSNANFLPAALVEIIQAAEAVGGDRYAVRVSADTAEQLRSVFTERLAKVGFDANYRPTPEGKMLEQLIDVFYLA